MLLLWSCSFRWFQFSNIQMHLLLNISFCWSYWLTMCDLPWVHVRMPAYKQCRQTISVRDPDRSCGSVVQNQLCRQKMPGSALGISSLRLSEDIKRLPPPRDLGEPIWVFIYFIDISPFISEIQVRSQNQINVFFPTEDTQWTVLLVYRIKRQ